MSETKEVNSERLEEVAGGANRVYQGRLTPSRTEFLTLIMKLAKQRGDTMEEFVNAVDSTGNYHIDFENETEREETIAATKEYIRTFWDRM